MVPILYMSFHAILDYNFLPINENSKNYAKSIYFWRAFRIVLHAVRITAANDFKRDAFGNAINPNTEQDFDTDFVYGKSASKFSLAIPSGVGLRYKFNYNWAIFGEFMFRPTFTDDIDYSKLETSSVSMTYNKDIQASANSTKSLLQTEPFLTVAKQRVDDYLKSRECGKSKF